MNLADITRLSYTQLGEKKVRTILTIVMVMIGVASIVALVSLTAGVSASISGQLQSLGPTSIILTSSSASGFTLTDLSGIGSLPNVSSVIPIVEGSGYLKTSGANTSVTIIGISPQYLPGILATSGINLYQGGIFNDTVTPSSLIGYDVAFPSTGGGRQEVAVGQPAALEVSSGRTTESYGIPVVGVLQSYSSLIVNINGAVIMSQPSAQALLHRQSFNVILVKAANTSSVAALTTQLSDVYGNNARVLSTQELAQTIASVIGGITLLLLLIAGISLLVAAVGIMNIMLMSVMERTHEIGVFKSLGFKNRHVLAIFLIQALIIGFIGGMVGIVVGAGASYSLAALSSGLSGSSGTGAGLAAGQPTLAASGGAPGGAFVGRGSSQSVSGQSPFSSSSSSSFSFSPLITLTTVVDAMIVAVLVSAIAGLYPAWRASRLEPIDALRQL